MWTNLNYKLSLASMQPIMRPERIVTAIDHIATGAALRERRKAAGVSMREMARRMGLSAPYVGDLELGRRAWTADRVANFEAKLDAKEVV